MEDKLRLNTVLYGGFEGVIGRHDYFLNQIKICSLMMLFTLPYQIWVSTHAQTLFQTFDIGGMFLSAPIFLKIWLVAGLLWLSVYNVSNISRRLNDINGEIRTDVNITCSVFGLILYFSILLPFQFTFLPVIFGIIMAWVLLLKKGKITSRYPYDFTKEFNWGAFLGTWIWGLCNKSYLPMLQIIIGCTPWAGYYAIWCGLKGNEWAFKNKNCTDVDAFNKSQKKQTTIFVVLFFLVVPLLYFALVGSIVAVFMGSLMKPLQPGLSAEEAKDSMAKVEETMGGVEDLILDTGKEFFVDHEISAEENKYYVNDSDWEVLDFNTKKTYLDTAASCASIEKSRQDKANNPSEDVLSRKYYSKTSELPITKIYSKSSNKLLGEYIMDEKALEGSAGDMIKAAMNAYHFYQP